MRKSSVGQGGMINCECNTIHCSLPSQITTFCSFHTQNKFTSDPVKDTAKFSSSHRVRCEFQDLVIDFSLCLDSVFLDPETCVLKYGTCLTWWTRNRVTPIGTLDTSEKALDDIPPLGAEQLSEPASCP